MSYDEDEETGFKSSFGEEEEDEFGEDPIDLVDTPDFGLDEEDPDKDH